jgi:YidC/Oxa1 family membrane protein insertase
MWDTLVINPMTNALLVLYDWLGNNFILAITFFTILIRVITLPLNLRQQRTMMRTQEIQPQIQAIQKKYKDNPQKMQEEFQKIGYNPAETLTGCLPTLIQFPILIGLYQAIILVLASTPQALFELQQRAYDFIRGSLSQLLPVENQFLWLNLGLPDPYFILPILVVATMFLQQKLLAPTPQRSQNGKEQENPAMAMTQSMQYTMPLMFGFFSLQFPAGLSIYFILSNIIGIAQGYYMRWTMNREKAANGTIESTASANGKAPSKAQTALQTGSNQSGNGARSDGQKQPDTGRSTPSATTSSKSAKSPASKPASSKRKRRSAKR